MEPWNKIDPFWEWVTLWAFRIWVGCAFLLLFYAIFKRTLTREQIEKELTGEDDKEED